jgi:hypothetical protein
LMETLIGLAVAPADNLRDATRSFSTGEEKWIRKMMQSCFFLVYNFYM